MDRTCATTWALCAIGLAVAGWAAVSTPRVAVSTAQHRGDIPRARAATHNSQFGPATTFVVGQPATSAR